VNLWRGQGLQAVIYLDDGIVAVSGEWEAQNASAQIQHDLSSAGFITNKAKCSWTPSQQCTWLGFKLDLEQGGSVTMSYVCLARRKDPGSLTF